MFSVKLRKVLTGGLVPISLVAAAAIAIFTAPQATDAQTIIYRKLPPFLPAIWPRVPPPYTFDMATLDAPSAVDTNGLPKDIEAATGGVLRVTGPVVLAPGPVASGGFSSGPSLLSAKVAFAEELQADEEIKVPGSRMAAGGRLYKATYFDGRDGAGKVVTAWCGPFQTVGLAPSTLLLCLEKLPDGRAKVYYSGSDMMKQEMYAEWYAAGLIDRDWAVIDWPKLSPVSAPEADKTLELIWSGDEGKWLGWRLSKAGEKRNWRLGNRYGRIGSAANLIGEHTVLIGDTQALVFDRDRKAKTMKLSGAVKFR